MAEADTDMNTFNSSKYRNAVIPKYKGFLLPKVHRNRFPERTDKSPGSGTTKDSREVISKYKSPEVECL